MNTGILLVSQKHDHFIECKYRQQSQYSISAKKNERNSQTTQVSKIETKKKLNTRTSVMKCATLICA